MFRLALVAAFTAAIAGILIHYQSEQLAEETAAFAIATASCQGPRTCYLTVDQNRKVLTVDNEGRIGTLSDASPVYDAATSRLCNNSAGKCQISWHVGIDKPIVLVIDDGYPDPAQFLLSDDFTSFTPFNPS